jgi:ribosomal protein L24E
MGDESSSFPTRCQYCGTPFEIGVRYPTVTEAGEDGALRIYTFCSEACKSMWAKERERG